MAENTQGSSSGETLDTNEMFDNEESENLQDVTSDADGKSAMNSALRQSSARQQSKQTTEEDSDGGDGDGDGDQTDNADEMVFDTWIAKQPAEVQELVTRQQKALRDALVEERQQRKTLSKQVGALSKKAEGNATATRELNELKATLVETQRRATFYESVPTDCANPKLAFAAAQMNGLIDKNGETDWTSIRQQMPELFKRITVPSANAGAGAKQTGADTEKSMNAFIRAALGRES